MINSTISFIEENNAGNAAAALMARLAPKTKVCLSVILLYFYNNSMHGTSCPEVDEKVVVLVLCSGNAPRGYLRVLLALLFFPQMGCVLAACNH